jgi:Xaa-Pro aminopeptidase
VVEHGKNGFLAGSLDDWMLCLQTLIESPALRFEMAEKAQETIKIDWLLSGHAQKWAEAYHAEAGKKRVISDDIIRQDSIWKKVLVQNSQKFEQVGILQARLAENDRVLAETSRLLEEKNKNIAMIKKNIVAYMLNRFLNRIKQRKSKTDIEHMRKL